MKQECVVQAPTIEDAVDAALEELGVQQDAVNYEVLEEPSRGLFGASREAKVRVWVKPEFLKEVEHAETDDGAVGDEVPTVGGNAAATEYAELTDEELDRVADTAVDTLRQILARFALENPTIEEYEGDDGEIILDVVGGELGILIGRHGRTLDALQAAVGAVTTRKLGFRYPVVVDVEGYRHRRRQKIEDIARRAAERAAKQRTSVRLRPMTAYERRVVHMVLRGDARVTTTSEGADPYRQVVVSPK